MSFSNFTQSFPPTLLSLGPGVAVWPMVLDGTVWTLGCLVRFLFKPAAARYALHPPGFSSISHITFHCVREMSTCWRKIICRAKRVLRTVLLIPGFITRQTHFHRNTWIIILILKKIAVIASKIFFLMSWACTTLMSCFLHACLQWYKMLGFIHKITATLALILLLGAVLVAAADYPECSETQFERDVLPYIRLKQTNVNLVGYCCLFLSRLRLNPPFVATMRQKIYWICS